MIPSVIYTISDLRFKTKDVLASAMKEPVTLFHRSTPKGVLMSVEKYQDLMSTLEDYYLSIRAVEFERRQIYGCLDIRQRYEETFRFVSSMYDLLYHPRCYKFLKKFPKRCEKNCSKD